MAISVTQLKLIQFIPVGLHEISNLLQQGMHKKGSKAIVGAKNEVEHIQGKLSGLKPNNICTSQIDCFRNWILL